jgi:hypothetical protein
MKFSEKTDHKYPTVVRHQGVAIAMALCAETTQGNEVCSIYYRVLAPDPAQPDDDRSWSPRRKLAFPEQIRPAGMGLVTADLKTAERTADAPFQAVSDGKHVYLFRQSTDGTLYVDRFVFDPAQKTLNPNWEARFQRSRKRDIPASRKDSLGARDMEGEPFFEPTTELAMVKDLEHGRFCALLLPGRLPSEWRWQILATNARGEIDSFSIRRGEDGLFDVTDVGRSCLKWADSARRFLTGPAALLYMQQEEGQDEYGRPRRLKRGARVMLAAPAGSARYALELDGVDDYVEIPSEPRLDLGQEFTIEAWVKPADDSGVPENARVHIVSRWGAEGSKNAYLLGLDSQGHLLLWTHAGSQPSQLTSEATIPADSWSHIAGVLKDGTLKVYINGEPDKQSASNAVAPQSSDHPLRFGADPIGRIYFKGQINNVRLWNVARTEQDIREGKDRRLTGTEKGLVGNWPFDEGSGATIHDQACENHGQLHLGGALALDGINDYVYMENFEWPNGGPVTVEFWAKVNAADVRNSSAFTVGNQDNPNRFQVLLPWSDKLLTWDYGNSGGGGRVGADYSPYLDRWTHVALVSAGNEGHFMGIYLNGKLVNESSNSDAPDVALKGLWIGKWPEKERPHKGEIADFRIWKRVRTQAEIQRDMHRRLAGNEPDLVGCWPFDEGQGDTIHDQSSEENHGELDVGCECAALEFDGVDDYVSIRALDLSADDTIAIEAWVKPADITTNQYYEIVRQQDYTGKWVSPDWLLAFQDRGTVLSFGLFAGGEYQELDVDIRPKLDADIQPTDYTDGKWHHILASYDGTRQYLYVDGVMIGSRVRSGDIRFSAEAHHSIGSSNGKAEFFKGQIGQVRIWKRARTGEEVRSDMDRPLAGDEPGLVGYWPLDEGSGDAIYDRASGYYGQLLVGTGDKIDGKWVPGPIRDDPAAKWRVGRDQPENKWVAAASLAVLDFGVSRQGTLARMGDVLLSVGDGAHGGDGQAAGLSIPRLELKPDAAGIAMPMPTCAMDDKGLTVCAGLLGLARSGETPFMLEGADGLLHLYFRGDYGEFLVAQYDTLTARAGYVLPLGSADDGPRLHFTARQPGTHMDGYQITVGGSHPETCQVVMDSQKGIKETWQNVPRDLEGFLAVLNGTATRDGDDPLVKEGKQVFYDYTSKENVQREGVPDLSSGDTPFFGSALFAVGADNVPSDAVCVRVKPNGCAKPDSDDRGYNGLDCRWIPEPQGKALQCAGGYVELPPDRLNVSGDLTLEAWVNVTGETSGRMSIVGCQRKGLRFGLGLVEDSNGKGHKVFAGSGDKAIQTDYAHVFGGEWTHLAAVYDASNALRLDGQGYVDCGKDSTLDITQTLTVEAWVTREGTNRGQPEVVLSKWGSTPAEQSWRLYIDTDNKPCFETRVAKGGPPIAVKADLPLEADQSYHLAGIFEGVPENVWALKLDKAEDFVTIAQGPNLTDASFSVAFWAKRDRIEPRLNQPVVGQGPNENYKGLHIGFRGDTNLFTFGFYGNDLDTPAYPDTEWHHWACTYDVSTGERTIYRDGVRVARDTATGRYQGSGALTIGRLAWWGHFLGLINNVRIWNSALAIEEVLEDMGKPARDVVNAVCNWAFDQRDSFGSTVTNLSGNWSHGARSGGKIEQFNKCRYAQRIFAYPAESEGVKESWRWVLQEDLSLKIQARLPANATQLGFSAPPDVKAGDTLLIEDEQVRVTSDPKPPGSVCTFDIERGVNGTVAHEHPPGTALYRLKPGDNTLSFSNTLLPSTASVNMGRSASEGDYFRGIIDEVRLWKVARRAAHIQYYCDHPLPGDAEGLVGHWRFEEGAGKTAIDTKGSNHGRLVHPEAEKIANMWTPAALNARLSLYVNGQEVAASDCQAVDYGDTQFCLGGMLSAGENGQPMAGIIDEVRVWNRVRTGEEIRDNMYRSLFGAEEGLVGYWTLNELNEEGKVTDMSGHSQDGTLVGAVTLTDSTPPIGNEGPEVRNAHAGLPKPGFNRRTAGPPAAVEYGDMQWDAEGELIAVMKRCYLFQDEAIQLITGFKVGDMELNFVGQVQTAPTLIGYIEGAPPVPSENLTVNDPATDDYVGTSSIQLTEARKTTQVYSTSRDSGFDMSVDLKAGVHWKTGAFAGVGVATEVFSSEGKVGVHAYVEYSYGDLSGASVSAGASKTLTKSLVLGGGWEEVGEGGRWLNPTVGQRYLPNNMGYALVKSATADLFALRLKQTGGLVAYQVVPNPDIPEDWNIIMFPLNPRYVKNGTLDGMVGTVPDPDYPDAIGGERGSYFKPLEAYALKEQIERDAKRIEGYYHSFETGVGVGGSAGELPGAELGYDWEGGRDRRSMANTYVWTADGGFYAEEEQFSSIRQESLGSSYHFLGKGGLYADIKLASPVGFFSEVDALFGGHINVTVSKSEEEEAAFGLHVDVRGEGNLNWDPIKKEYMAKPCPGKVDGYRFMTFYLQPKPDNFDKFFADVVDPDWLNGQGKYSGDYSPNARALREARAKPNEVWRVLHRVTYVSRVPQSGSPPEEVVPKDVRRPANVEANMGLIQEIERLVPHPPSLIDLGAAVDTLLGQPLPSGDDGWSPGELEDIMPWWPGVKPEAKKDIRQDVIEYLKGYYEIDPARSAGGQSETGPETSQPSRPPARRMGLSRIARPKSNSPPKNNRSGSGRSN